MNKAKQDKLIKKIKTECPVTEQFSIEQTETQITIIGSQSMGHHFTSTLYRIVNRHKLMCFVIIFSNKIHFVIHW